MKTTFFIFLFLPFLFFSQENKSGAFNLLINAGVSPAQIHGDAYSGYHKMLSFREKLLTSSSNCACEHKQGCRNCPLFDITSCKGCAK